MASSLELTQPEAALLVSALVAFADDDPSEEEGVVLRKYYRFETGESAQAKLNSAGHAYPADLRGLEPQILEVLSQAEESFRLRTVAVAWKLAQADGTVDQQEMRTLNRIADGLGIGLADAASYARSGLREIDETEMYHRNAPPSEGAQPIDFTPDEAGFALAALVSFSDDDPSDAEVAVIREYYGREIAQSAMERMKASGYRYPDDLALTKGAVRRALGTVSRDRQVRALAIAWKTAAADGAVVPQEALAVKDFCEHFVIGLAEVKQYFKATPSLV